MAETHAIDCDMGHDCTCGASEREEAAALERLDVEARQPAGIDPNSVTVRRGKVGRVLIGWKGRPPLPPIEQVDTAGASHRVYLACYHHRERLAVAKDPHGLGLCDACAPPEAHGLRESIAAAIEDAGAPVAPIYPLEDGQGPHDCTAPKCSVKGLCPTCFANLGAAPGLRRRLRALLAAIEDAGSLCDSPDRCAGECEGCNVLKLAATIAPAV